MKKKVMLVDEFEKKCGFAYVHEPFCNGGHNCKHPDSSKETIKGEDKRRRSWILLCFFLSVGSDGR